MSDIAIHVENLSKLYHIGRLQQRNDTLRDALVDGLRRIGRRKKQLTTDENTLWALKEVSFDVHHGEAMGIIGHNGAGKSTLLKILSQITEPTRGRVVINGRVGSLLEVGTGFHPELTGRENIYLNGAILGMSRKEIEQKFDEIVDFAEIDRFLDTPVKRYSSGMYVRLAFAVAAHLEPEILLVDEVLAVGDIEFQKKCLGKMNNVTSEGRTVLFVSHNLNSIQRLCQNTLLLEKGRLMKYAHTSAVISEYISAGLVFEKPEIWIRLPENRANQSPNAYFTQIWYSGNSTDSANQPYPNGPLEFRLRIYSDARRTVSSLAVTLYDQYGSKLVNSDTMGLGISTTVEHGNNEILLRIEQLHLNPGIYTVGLWLANPPGIVFDRIDQALRIEVVDLETEKLGRRPVKDGIVTNYFSVKLITGQP